jgi:hypothetical protein
LGRRCRQVLAANAGMVVSARGAAAVAGTAAVARRPVGLWLAGWLGVMGCSLLSGPARVWVSARGCPRSEPGCGQQHGAAGPSRREVRGLGRRPAGFPPVGQSCDPLVARSGFVARVVLSSPLGGRSARCRCSPPMSPPCSKVVAGNSLGGRYLARVWRVLDRRRHERGDVPQRRAATRPRLPG